MIGMETDTQEIRDALKKNIKKYRKAKALSQSELAEKANISVQTINSIEGARLWPSDKVLSKIADALGVEMYRLFVPHKLAMQSEAVAELKYAIAKTIEDLVHETLDDWKNQ